MHLYIPWLTETIKKRGVRYLLHHYLGQFFLEKLTLEQLSIDIYQGKGSIMNLLLDVDGLNEALDFMPLKFLDGCSIGQISVEVPWSSLSSDACRVELEGAKFVCRLKTSADARKTLSNDNSILNKSTTTTSVQMAENIVSPEETHCQQRDYLDGLNEPSEEKDSEQMFEGLEIFAQLIDSIIGRTKFTAKDTVFQIRSSLESEEQKDDDIDIFIKFLAFEQVRNQDKSDADNGSNNDYSDKESETVTKFITLEEVDVRIGDSSDSKFNDPLSPTSIFKCDTMNLEMKLNKYGTSSETNLQLKVDMAGVQYIHSRSSTNLLSFYKAIQMARRASKNNQHSTNQRRTKITFNKFFNINIKEGLFYIVDNDCRNLSIVPMLEFSLEDFRIIHFSGKHQQNGSLLAKLGCAYYNRENSVWDPMLDPWPFNLSWDVKSTSSSSVKNRHRKFYLNSEEEAYFTLSSAFLDLGQIVGRMLIDSLSQQKPRPLALGLESSGRALTRDLDSIFVLHNETGHKLQFAPLELDSALFEMLDTSRSSSSPLSGVDDSAAMLVHKLSTISWSSNGSRDSPDLGCLARWITVADGETVAFQYETLPVYRRHFYHIGARLRKILVRVEGWKVLSPISIDKTGAFYRAASSDRVRNEDTYMVVTVALEEHSARKIISVRSPLTIMNELDTSVEVHFQESDRALYVRPNSHLSVPLPVLYNSIRVRPCDVGVNMSSQIFLWDNIPQSYQAGSKQHVCRPISLTDYKHASYCQSKAYRVCVATHREGLPDNDDFYEAHSPQPIPIYAIHLIAPLTIINLLPVKLQYAIGDTEGSVDRGHRLKIHQVDTTRPSKLYFFMRGFPRSKPINIDPGATGSFHHTLEMIDKSNRSLYLNAKVILACQGEEPAVQVYVAAPYWLLNKTRLPLIFKQEGSALEAAGQTYENEETSNPILLFSFYEFELEPPWLCSMRIGRSKGISTWCEGFKLDKGSGERRLRYIPKDNDLGSDTSKSLVDINIRRGFGMYSETMIVTLTARYGFDPLTKTPSKLLSASPHDYKLTSYNHAVNLAERFAPQPISLFKAHHRETSDLQLVIPGINVALVDHQRERFMEGSIRGIEMKCNTDVKEQVIDCSFQDVRVNNVLPDCEKSVTLDRAQNLDESMNAKPAIRLIMDRILANSYGTTLFRQVQLSMCELVLNIEEKLILKLVEFATSRRRRKRKDSGELTKDQDIILHSDEDRKPKYYFDLLRIDLSSVRLSVFTTASLPNSLQSLKNHLGLNFFGFEDAHVDLEPYLKLNVSQTLKGVFQSVTRFYKRQVIEQAPRIVGQQIQNYLRFYMSDLLSTLYDEVYHKLFS